MQRHIGESVHLVASGLDSAAVLGPLSLLVVEPSIDELLALVATLSRAGFNVTAAQSFEEARPYLAARPPWVLVTALRLGIYNGLHLVVRGKAVRPDMATLVMSTIPDLVLQSEADALGATFLVKPLPPRDLIAAVLQTIFRRDATAPPLRPPFERRLTERRANVVSFNPDRRHSDRRRILPWLVQDQGNNHC
jgi:DNA-binding response OmpR family regulator